MGEAKRRGSYKERLEQSLRREIEARNSVRADPDQELRVNRRRLSKATITALAIGMVLGHHD